MPIIVLIVVLIGGVIGYQAADHYLAPKSAQVQVEQTRKAPQPAQPARPVVPEQPQQPAPPRRPKAYNQPPVVTAAPVYATYGTGEAIELTTSGYDPDGQIVRWQLQCGLFGQSVYADTLDSIKAQHCFAYSEGLLTIIVRATDDDGVTTEARTEVKLVDLRNPQKNQQEIADTLLYLQERDPQNPVIMILIIIFIVLSIATVAGR